MYVVMIFPRCLTTELSEKSPVLSDVPPRGSRTFGRQKKGILPISANSYPFLPTETYIRIPILKIQTTQHPKKTKEKIY